MAEKRGRSLDFRPVLSHSIVLLFIGNVRDNCLCIYKTKLYRKSLFRTMNNCCFLYFLRLQTFAILFLNIVALILKVFEDFIVHGVVVVFNNVTNPIIV